MRAAASSTAERERVESGAELGDLLGGLEPGALAEEGDGLGLASGGTGYSTSPVHAQELAAR